MVLKNTRLEILLKKLGKMVLYIEEADNHFQPALFRRFLETEFIQVISNGRASSMKAIILPW